MRKQLTIVLVLILGLLALLKSQHYLFEASSTTYDLKTKTRESEGESTKLTTLPLSTPKLISNIALSMDLNSEKVIFSKEGERKGYPASLTKILTAILLLENVKEDEEIAMTKTALQQPEGEHVTAMTFSVGETFNRKNALNMMMIISANEVAKAVGEHIAGSEEAFAIMMNKRAKELGATHSHFINASGVFNKNHFTTAKDMALIMKEALKFPEIKSAMATKEYITATSNQAKKITNKNSMFNHPTFVCGKPGYTTASHSSLVVLDNIENHQIIHVLMDSDGSLYLNDLRELDSYYKEQLKNHIIIN